MKHYEKDASGKYHLVTDKQETPVVAINQEKKMLLSIEELEKLKKDILKAFDMLKSEVFTE